MAPVTFPISETAFPIIQGSEIYSRPEKYDGGSQAAKDACAALQAAHRRRVGKGYSYAVSATRAGAEIIEDYCRTVGETFAFETEPETRSDGRALLKAAEKIAGMLPCTPED